MDEENNAKKKAKTIKTIRRSLFLIVKLTAPIFLFILLIVIMWYVIEESVSIDVATGTAGALAESTSISEDGEITVDEEVYERIRNALIEKGIDPEAFWLGEKNFVEGTNTTYLEKMASAEIVSSYPDTGTGDIRGIIKVHRNNEAMEYKNQEDFNSLISSAQSNGSIDSMKKYFTLDEELNIVVATYSSKTVKDAEGNETTTFTANPSKIAYKSYVSQYTVPFEFLFSLMQATENPEYVAKVADLILEDSEIVLNLYDTTSTIVNTTEVTWDDVKYKGEKKSTTGYDYNVSLSFDSRETKGPETTVETTVSNSVTLKVTYVKTWIYDKTATYIEDTATSTNTAEPTTEDRIIGTVKTETSKDGDEYVVKKERIDIENRTTTVTTDTTLVTWKETGDSTEEINTDRFLGLWKNESGEYEQGALYKEDGNVVLYHVPKLNVTRSPAKYITAYPELLFEYLQNSSDTQNTETLMRYILYIYTGKNYGVTSIDLSMFQPNFNGMNSGKTALAEWTRSYEFNMLREYRNGDASQEEWLKEKKYIRINDEGELEYGLYELNVSGDHSLNFSYGLRVYGFENSKTVDEYIELFNGEGIDLQAIVDQWFAEGEGWANADAVDRIQLRIINKLRQPIDDLYKQAGIQLEPNELDALTAVTYMFGNCGGTTTRELFAKHGNTDDFKKEAVAKNSGEGWTHFFLGGTNRYEEFWLMFHENIYRLSTGQIIDPEMYSRGYGGTLLEAAEALHKQMEEEQWTYYNETSYPLYYNDIEKSIYNTKATCCATYVNSCIYLGGLLGKDEINSEEYSINDTGCSRYLMNKWQVIRSNSELQPGDVVFFDYEPDGDYNHVEIYAGDGCWYGAGSTGAIRREAPSSLNNAYLMSTFAVAVRP